MYKRHIFILALTIYMMPALVGVYYPYPIPEIVANLLLCYSLSPVLLCMLVFFVMVISGITGDWYVGYQYFVSSVLFVIYMKRDFLFYRMMGKDIIQVFMFIGVFSCFAMILQMLFPSLFESILYINLGGGRRAAGLQQEPSHLIALVAISLFYIDKKNNALYWFTVLMFTAFMAKSELIYLFICFYLLLKVSSRVSVLYKRFVVLFVIILVATKYVWLAQYLLTDWGSWRSLPDAAIVYNIKDFLLPSIDNSKGAIKTAIDNMLGIDTFIVWTYSIFSTVLVTYGFLLALLIIFVMNKITERGGYRGSKVMLAIGLLIFPKNMPMVFVLSELIGDSRGYSYSAKISAK